MLRVCSWNVLADAYVRDRTGKVRFGSSDASLLVPGARVDPVLQQATSYEADIVLMQEGDEPLAHAARSRLERVGWTVVWAPKPNREDGCLTLLRRGWNVEDSEVLLFTAGDPKWGHLASVVKIRDESGRRATIVNSHLRWGAPGTPPSEHLGVQNATQIVEHLDSEMPVILGADLYDRPGGPTRAVLEAAGFDLLFSDRPTAFPNDNAPACIDTIAVRGVDATPVETGIEAVRPLPRPTCPSDHLPLVADVHLEATSSRPPE